MALTFFPTGKKMDLFKFWACTSLQPLTLFKKTEHFCSSICSIKTSKKKVTAPSLPGRALTKSVWSATWPIRLQICSTPTPVIPRDSNCWTNLLNHSCQQAESTFMLSQNSCCWRQTVRHHWTESMEYLAISLVWNGKLGSFFLMLNKTL